MTENTTASGAADFPEFPAHPEPQIMRWSALEIVAIRRYGADMFRAGRLAASAPVAPTQPESLHTFLNAAAAEGYVLNGVDAADLYVELFTGATPLQQGEYLPLPEPDTHCYDDDKQVDVWSHSADQMHAYVDAHLAARGAAQAAPADAQRAIAELRAKADECISTQTVGVFAGLAGAAALRDIANKVERALAAPPAPSAQDAEDAADERENLVSSFWSMLRECESQADNDNDPVLKVQVEGYYRQWNACTGSEHSPRWIDRAARAQHESGKAS